MRLNLGSGPTAVPGWINIDRSPNVLLDRLPSLKRVLFRLHVLDRGHMAPWDRAVVRQNILKLPYETGSVEAVYTSHTLEHLYMDEARQVLQEAARVLRPGGHIRIALPDAVMWARELLADPADPEAGRRFNERLLAHPMERPRWSTFVRDLAGGHVHRWQPTAALVAEMMTDAGFTRISQQEFRQGSLPGLEEVETRPESFFLEGVRPSSRADEPSSSTRDAALHRQR